jgi:hypothetical protein
VVFTLVLVVLTIVSGTLPASASIPIAHDDFEEDSFDGGLGWLQDWTIESNVTVTSGNSPHGGSHHMRLRGYSSAVRSADITGESNLSLRVWVKLATLDDDGAALLQTSDDGVHFTNLFAWNEDDEQSSYQNFEVDLSGLGYGAGSELWVRFVTEGHNNDAVIYVDDLEIVDVGGVLDDPPPLSSPQIVIDSDFTDWDGKAFLNDPSGDHLGLSRNDIAAMYWANNQDDEVNFHMIERHTTDGQAYNGSNGQTKGARYVLYVDVNNNGNYSDGADRLVQVNYIPKHFSGQVRVRVRHANTYQKISDTGWNDWGQNRDEGGLKFEFPVSWDDLGFGFGGVVRMYAASYLGPVDLHLERDRVPDGSADVQWSPASILGPWLLAGAAFLGILAIWFFRGRRVWT